ncbi:MAG: porin family protein [Acidiferrobacter sp.]
MRHTSKVTRILRMLGMGSCALVAFGSRAYASHIEYGLGYTGVYSDNIYRTSTDKRDEYINMLRGLFSYQKHSRRIDMHLDLEALGREFTYGTYNNDVLFGVNSLTHVVVLPKMFSLSERDIFTQAPIDPRFVLAPTNLENTNAFSAGPNFSWYVDPIDAFKVGLRYQNFYYQDVQTSNYRLLARTRFVHWFTHHTKLSLNYVPSNVRYNDTQLNPDYNRQDAYVGFDTTVGNAGLTIEGGHTEIEQTGVAQSLSGALERIAITDRLGPRSRFTLAGDRSYGDAGRYDLLEAPAQNLIAIPVATNPSQIAGGGLYYGQTASLDYSYLRDYGTNRVNVFWQHLNFVTAPLTQRLEGAVFNFGYDFSDRVTDSIFGDYVRVNYLDYHTITDDYGGGMRLRYRLTPNLSVSLEGMYDRGNSNDPILSYNEWRGIIGISYLTNPRRMRSNPFVHYTNEVFM